MKKRVLSAIIAFLISIPTILAYSYRSLGYYRSPLEYLDNEWVMFITILLVFFAIIYYTVNKAFKNNMVSAVTALGLSLLISVTILRRNLLYGFVGDDLGSWVLLAAAIIAFGFLIRFSYEGLGTPGAIIAAIAVWLFIHNTDPYAVLPYGANDTLIWVYEVMVGFRGLFIVIIISAIFARFLRGKSPWEYVTDKFLGRR